MGKSWVSLKASFCYVIYFKINSIADVIPSSFEKSPFVDDFSIACSSRNMASIERQLQLCLNKVEKWADENGCMFACISVLKENFIQTQH